MAIINIAGKAISLGGKVLSSLSLSPLPPIAAPVGSLGISLAPRVIYAGANANTYPHPVGNPQVTGATSAVAVSVSDPSGQFTYSDGVIYKSTAAVPVGTYPVAVTATETATGRTVTESFTFQVVAGAGVYIAQTRISNATPADYKIGMNAVNITTFEDITWTLSDPSGRFFVDPHYWYIGFRNGVVPPVGSYPVTVRVTNKAGVALDTAFTLEVYAEPQQTAPTFTAFPISSVDEEGTVVGKLSAYNALGVYRYSVVDASGDVAGFVSPMGEVKLARSALATGLHTFTAVVSNGVTSASATCNFTVTQGYVLPAENMRLSVAPALDNYKRDQLVGTPEVSGMTGTPKWTITNEGDGYLDYFGNDQSLFRINADTGLITAQHQVPARSMDHPVEPTPGHRITVACSDGVNRCARSFDVPVAWVSGPTLYVGAGMAQAHPGAGYEHWSDLLPLISPANGILDPAFAGARIKVAANADPDYYACDNGNGQNGFAENYQNRFGIGGPLTIEALDPTGPRPRMGGFMNSGGGGVDISGKGFMTFSNGDQIVRGLEVSFVQGPADPSVDNSHGVSGIRKNGQCYGDFHVLDCYIHDCNNDIETGFRAGRDHVESNILANAGTAYVSSGATHNLYAGATPFLTFRGNLTHRTMNGHSLKTRAFAGLVEGNRMYDGERGSSSAVIDIPQGGIYTIRNNVIHKGPNAQNSGALQLSADEDTSRDIVFDVYDNVFSVQSLTEHYGAPSAIKHTRTLNVRTGVSSVVTARNNQFYLAEQARALEEPETHDGHPVSGRTPAVVTGSVILSTPPALDFTDPGTARPVAARVAFYNAIQEQSVGNNYDNYFMVQIDPGADDLRIPASSAAGYVVCDLAAYGANIWQFVSPTDPRIDPFVGGATFSITRTLDPYYYGSGNPFAPVGRYAIEASGPRTAKLKVAGALVAGTDFVKLRATSPSGVIAEARIYISVI